MSLKKFSELFVDLDSSNSTNNKIEVLKNYFLSNDPIDNSWAIYLLTGKNNRRFISGRYLKNLFSQIYEYPQWLIDTCYLKVGDSAEVITLLLKNKTKEYTHKTHHNTPETLPNPSTQPPFINSPNPKIQSPQPTHKQHLTQQSLKTP